MIKKAFLGLFVILAVLVLVTDAVINPFPSDDTVWNYGMLGSYGWSVDDELFELSGSADQLDIACGLNEFHIPETKRCTILRSEDFFCLYVDLYDFDADLIWVTYGEAMQIYDAYHLDELVEFEDAALQILDCLDLDIWLEILPAPANILCDADCEVNSFCASITTGDIVDCSLNSLSVPVIHKLTQDHCVDSTTCEVCATIPISDTLDFGLTAISTISNNVTGEFYVTLLDEPTVAYIPDLNGKFSYFSNYLSLNASVKLKESLPVLEEPIINFPYCENNIEFVLHNAFKFKQFLNLSQHTIDNWHNERQTVAIAALPELQFGKNWYIQDFSKGVFEGVNIDCLSDFTFIGSPGCGLSMTYFDAGFKIVGFNDDDNDDYIVSHFIFPIGSYITTLFPRIAEQRTIVQENVGGFMSTTCTMYGPQCLFIPDSPYEWQCRAWGVDVWEKCGFSPKLCPFQSCAFQDVDPTLLNNTNTSPYDGDEDYIVVNDQGILRNETFIPPFVKHVIARNGTSIGYTMPHQTRCVFTTPELGPITLPDYICEQSTYFQKVDVDEYTCYHTDDTILPAYSNIKDKINIDVVNTLNIQKEQQQQQQEENTNDNSFGHILTATSNHVITLQNGKIVVQNNVADYDNVELQYQQDDQDKSNLFYTLAKTTTTNSESENENILKCCVGLYFGPQCDQPPGFLHLDLYASDDINQPARWPDLVNGTAQILPVFAINETYPLQTSHDGQFELTTRTGNFLLAWEYYGLASRYLYIYVNAFTWNYEKENIEKLNIFPIFFTTVGAAAVTYEFNANQTFFTNLLNLEQRTIVDFRTKELRPMVITDIVALQFEIVSAHNYNLTSIVYPTTWGCYHRCGPNGRCNALTGQCECHSGFIESSHCWLSLCHQSVELLGQTGIYIGIEQPTNPIWASCGSTFDPTPAIGRDVFNNTGVCKIVYKANNTLWDYTAIDWVVPTSELTRRCDCGDAAYPYNYTTFEPLPGAVSYPVTSSLIIQDKEQFFCDIWQGCDLLYNDFPQCQNGGFRPLMYSETRQRICSPKCRCPTGFSGVYCEVINDDDTTTSSTIDPIPPGDDSSGSSSSSISTCNLDCGLYGTPNVNCTECLCPPIASDEYYKKLIKQVQNDTLRLYLGNDTATNDDFEEFLAKHPDWPKIDDLPMITHFGPQCRVVRIYRAEIHVPQDPIPLLIQNIPEIVESLKNTAAAADEVKYQEIVDMTAVDWHTSTLRDVISDSKYDPTTIYIDATWVDPNDKTYHITYDVVTSIVTEETQPEEEEDINGAFNRFHTVFNQSEQVLIRNGLNTFHQNVTRYDAARIVFETLQDAYFIKNNKIRPTTSNNNIQQLQQQKHNFMTLDITNNIIDDNGNVIIPSVAEVEQQLLKKYYDNQKLRDGVAKTLLSSSTKSMHLVEQLSNKNQQQQYTPLSVFKRSGIRDTTSAIDFLSYDDDDDNNNNNSNNYFTIQQQTTSGSSSATTLYQQWLLLQQKHNETKQSEVTNPNTTQNGHYLDNGKAVGGTFNDKPGVNATNTKIYGPVEIECGVIQCPDSYWDIPAKDWTLQPQHKPKKTNSAGIIAAVVVIILLIVLFIAALFGLRYCKKEKILFFKPKPEKASRKRTMSNTTGGDGLEMSVAVSGTTCSASGSIAATTCPTCQHNITGKNSSTHKTRGGSMMTSKVPTRTLIASTTNGGDGDANKQTVQCHMCKKSYMYNPETDEASEMPLGEAAKGVIIEDPTLDGSGWVKMSLNSKIYYYNETILKTQFNHPLCAIEEKDDALGLGW